MQPTHYQSSKGRILIADMPEPYLRNAADKLRRTDRHRRSAELAAMDARLAELTTQTKPGGR